MKIKDNKKQGIFFTNLNTGFKSFIDPRKEDLLLNNISLGLGNKIASEKYPGFRWPLWLDKAAGNFSSTCHSRPDPLLLNTNLREWQIFTNYISSDEITVDRCGMISGPGDAPWSVEFWYNSNDRMFRPQDDLTSVHARRDHHTGVIEVKGSLGNTRFTERIAGIKSSVNEALVSYEIDSKTNDDIAFILIRPYNNVSVGGLNSIEFSETGNLVKINSKQHVGLETKPDYIYTGSGSAGDISVAASDNKNSVFCDIGLAAMAFGYSLKKGTNSFNIRISLESNMSLTPFKFDLMRSFKEFYNFTEIRLNEGLKMEIPDEELNIILRQSRLTLLNFNTSDFNANTIEGFRNLYFFSYAMNRTGQELDAERIIHAMIEKFSYDRKNPEFARVICGSFLVNSFTECYVHKRESEFLQKYFSSLRQIGDYIYSYSTEVHSIEQLPGNTRDNNFIKEATEYDFSIILYAMTNLSYLSRCMGIFGDESKYKNEADRIQSLVKAVIEKKKILPQNTSVKLPSLLAFPEVILPGYKNDEYRELLLDLCENDNYPVFNKFSGIDLFLTVSFLIHLITFKDSRFYAYYEKCLTLIDDFFVLPEFIDPVTRKGVWGSGNSKIIASLLFILMRNRIFLDRVDRLELFPVPEKKWFAPGNRIKVQDAPTRYGRISFIVEIIDSEIKLTFTSLPKFIPSDIMINIPVETSIVESDDFILKRKIDNSYIVNGWPAAIRFLILQPVVPFGTSA